MLDLAARLRQVNVLSWQQCKRELSRASNFSLADEAAAKPIRVSEEQGDMCEYDITAVEFMLAMWQTGINCIIYAYAQ